ncbi:MAG: sulfur carrier protein ThiS adenylyltransferase ThiF [Bacteroidales bacterium]|jgi:sulfur carrier protein ThiS adenylyltransferase|nr:sulfur carrier protein ThiS adenylyltransferase ThiF [Bacteroidales bacterium]
MKYEELRKKLSGCRVGIAGAGGLGSNCAQALARCGVGTIVIADFDMVEETNLNRQFFFRDQVGMKKVDALKTNLGKIGTGSVIVAHCITLNPENIPEVFNGCDVVVEAFDSAEMKMMLIETITRKMPAIPVVAGSGLAGLGSNDTIKSRKVDDNLYIIGDESMEVSDENPPLAPRVGIVACMQANIVVELLLKR